MAHFYGTVQGTRGEASRLGTKSTGLTTEACSYAGKISVYISHDEKTGTDRFDIRMKPHLGKGEFAEIASGTLGDASTVVHPLPQQPAEPMSQLECDAVAKLAEQFGASVKLASAMDMEHLLQFTPSELVRFIKMWSATDALVPTIVRQAG